MVVVEVVVVVEVCANLGVLFELPARWFEDKCERWL